MKRRDFLKAGTAGLAGAITGSTGMLTWSPRARAATITKTLYITDGFINQIDGTSVYFRGYSNSSGTLDVPGESMIVQEGDTVEITLVNTLATEHNFVIDGMADSGVVGAFSSRTFSFTAGNPGTYMFYDNANGVYNQLLGLHGGFAVMPQNSSNELYPGSRTFVQQQFWLFHDIDPAWNDRLRQGLTPNTAYVPRYFTLNGLGGRPPGAPGNADPNVNSMIDPRSALHGSIGDRTLVRILNAGLAAQSVHVHGNHMEWLTENGQIRPDVWEKDCLYLDGNRGILDMIYPYDVPPDSWPPATHGEYPMHLHSEMSQTAAGGYYLFGAITDIFFE
ncbi:MAG TPA: twin-arginine translocation signal domain-containing protein [Gammaproteobacteria bacterium]|nr:twin-arginine translocation signal domain-containing protein [Gammaproteobacteria bacterium]